MLHPYVEEVELHLRSISILIRHHTRELLTQYDLTLPQYYALIHLRKHRLTMGELCCRLYLASSTVTDLVDRMEKLDLVTRVRDEEDRRVISIEVQDAGRQIIERVMQDRLRFLSERLRKLNEKQVEKLVTLLEELHTLMESN